MTGRQRDETTYSLTLCVCKGCKKGPPAGGAGVLLSDMEEAWRIWREGVGLKRPGEETGVLLAVRKGIEADWARGPAEDLS